MVELINEVGIFLQDVAAGLYLVERYQPCSVLLMDANPTQIQYVRDNSPQTEIVFWKHEGASHWSTLDPEWWADTIWSQIASCPPDYVYYWNEPLWHGATEQFPDFDDRQARFIRRMRQLSGGRVKVGAFCFAEGNFTKDGPDLPVSFPKSLDEAEIVFIHEYWKPRLNSVGMEGYHCQRWEYWLGQFERVGRSDLSIAVTEYGLTMAVGGGPDVGYLSEEAKAAGVTWQNYRDDISEYHAYCCLEPRIKFIIPFLCSPWPGQWQTFRLDTTPELLDYIMTMQAPGEIPEEPNGGKTMRVFNIDGTELFGATAADLVALHGLTIQEPNGLQNGDWYYKLVELDEREGPACFIYTVLDQNGNPWANQETAWGWPNMGDANDIGDNRHVTDWRTEADLGPTNENGNNGPGFGQSGWWHDAYKPGPGFAWIRHPSNWSTFMIGIGMLGGTNHRRMDGTWQFVQYQGTTPPPPEPGGIPPMEGSLLDRVLELEVQVKSLGSLDIAEMLSTISQIKSLIAG